MKTRIVAYAAGLALIALGLRGIVMDVPVTAWAAWFAGAVLVHDGVLVPVVLAAGLLTGPLPGRYRRIVRAALLVGACVTAVALPLVLGHGRRADEPSRLPLPYERNLAVVLGCIAAAAACAAVARAVIARAVIVHRGRRGGGAARAAPPAGKGPGR
ncbi:hypothetical protein [Actinomadura formosensis]|uniref:hypothetical protein n=1 Tax=Actinomadura formosensis TaxID=60706 RepID=UPI000A06F123|nr:hypothetical protein [Actinomadura formosensis]